MLVVRALKIALFINLGFIYSSYFCCSMKKYWFFVVLLALVVFGIRVYLAFSVLGFSDDAAYTRLRVVEHVQNTWLPLVHDPLIARHSLSFSFFDYVLAIFSFFTSVEGVAKVIPNLFAALLVPFFFLLALKLSKNAFAAFFSTLLFSFYPDFFAYTFNSASHIPFVFFLLTVLSLSLFSVSRSVIPFVFFLLLFALTHPSVLLFAAGLGIALLLTLAQQNVLSHENVEVTLFTLFFVFTTQLLLYHAPLLQFGASLLSSNVPEELLPSTFPSLSILDAIAHIGIFTIIITLVVAYQALLNRNKSLYFFIALLSITSLFLWMKLIPLHLGMLFFVFASFLLLNVGVGHFLEYLKKIRLVRSWIIPAVFVVVIFISTTYPLFSTIRNQMHQAPSLFEMEAARWLAQSTPSQTMVIAPPSRGAFLAYTANRSVILDTYYFTTLDAPQKYVDIMRLFTTPFEIEAVDIMEKYHADYIFAPLFVPKPKYIPSTCFSIAYVYRARVYAKSSSCTRSL